MATFTAENGLAYIDLTDYPWTTDEFYDFLHVNSTGIAIVNAMLGRRPCRRRRLDRSVIGASTLCQRASPRCPKTTGGWEAGIAAEKLAVEAFLELVLEAGGLAAGGA